MRRLQSGRVCKIMMVALHAFMLSGCWSFYAVRSTFSVSGHEQPNPDVTETKAYQDIIDSVERIAVKAPDGCANETSSESRGETTSSDVVLLKSNCGQEMALLERGLAKAKYKVVSWSVVNSRSHAENRAPLDIAKDMKADLLLQVNSMERLFTRAGGSLGWDRRYYRSDSRWNIFGPAAVGARTEHQIVRDAKAIESRVQAGRTSVNLNATATSVKTGEAIWFYDWTLADSGSNESIETLSFSACSKKNGLCKPWLPRLRDDGRLGYSSGTSDAENQSPVEDERRAKHYQLIKRLVSNMVETLKNGPPLSVLQDE